MNIPYRLCVLSCDAETVDRWLPLNACRADGTVFVDHFNDGRLWTVTKVYEQELTEKQLIALGYTL